MTLFGDYYFFAVVGILLLPAIVLGLLEKNIKYYGFFLTCLMIYMVMREKPMGMVNLSIYVLYQLILVKTYLYLTLNRGRKKAVYYGFIIASLLPLSLWKVSAFAGMHHGHGILAFLGISYMSFKSLQMIIEIYDGLIDKVGIFEFVYFLTFFPCLSSGPIDRSRRFHDDMITVADRKDYIEMIGDGLFKIMLGMFYKFVCAAGLYQAIIWLGGTGDTAQLWNHIVYMYSYGTYLFFDFAGYSLMAVGVSYILGVKSPDNFNLPFISKDMKEFWDRWHMSLSYWFRDFLFSRFMMKAIRGKWFKSKLTGASIGFLINMTIMGIWHGLDIYYIMYGVYHGMLLAITEIYQKKSKFHKTYKKEGWYKGMSLFITFNLVMFGFFIFSGRFTQIIGLRW